MSVTQESVIALRHPSGSCAEINLYGATVTSFYAANEPERNVLFVSRHAVLDGRKPIRGGIPLVFPVFGAAKGFPNHGFARNFKWKATQVEQSGRSDDEHPSTATFVLESSDEIKAMYPYDVTLVYDVKLFANELITALSVQNKSEQEVTFHALLHTYLSVDDVREGRVRVEGLKGLRYFDKVLAEAGDKTEQTDALTVEQETDRIYMNAPSSVVVRMQRLDDKKQQVVTIDKMACLKSSSTSGDLVSQKVDVVVWNPWINKAKSMSDFGDDEYSTMLCVEPGCVSEQQKLPGGHTYMLQQNIRLSAL
uniref:glucose-6-phosphate 1-epimerase n=1 Tax=Peronospora matthiolae TaxID=2874970 RepID=A0AAV1VEJ1_9STRA